MTVTHKVSGCMPHSMLCFRTKLLATGLASLLMIMGLNGRAAVSPWWLLMPLGFLALLDGSQKAVRDDLRSRMVMLRARLESASDKERDLILRDAALQLPEDEGLSHGWRAVRALFSLSVWPFYLALAGGLVGWFHFTEPATEPAKTVSPIAKGVLTPRPVSGTTPGNYPGPVPPNVLRSTNRPPGTNGVSRSFPTQLTPPNTRPASTPATSAKSVTPPPRTPLPPPSAPTPSPAAPEAK